MMRTKDKKKNRKETKECKEKKEKVKNIWQTAQMTQNGSARKPDIHGNKTKKELKKNRSYRDKYSGREMPPHINKP